MAKPEDLKQARAAIGTAMGWAVGAWFIPIPVVGSLACNKVETVMVGEILKALGGARTDEVIGKFFWYFRKKYLLVNAVTFVPYVGATVQLLEVYALGQFVLAACEENRDPGDASAMEAAWAEVEPKIWNAEDVVAFYEDATGDAFPADIRGPFTTAVGHLGKLPQVLNRVPGMQKTQEVVGEGMRQATALAGDGWRKLKKAWS